MGTRSSILRHLLSMPDKAAHALVLRDFDTWVRLEFLGAASRTGLVAALSEPGTIAEIGERANIVDHELLEAVLDLGVSLGELRVRRGRYRIRGRRLRAIAGDSEDLQGLVEELVYYDSPIYAALGDHLRGLARQDYLDGVGDVIARASRTVEPILGPTVRSVAAEIEPKSILDIGCGTGVNLGHALAAAPQGTALGIDLDANALGTAREHLASEVADGRCTLRNADVRELQVDDESFDLVLLLNNIYYWPPEERPGVLRDLRRLVAPGGTLVVASATAHGRAVGRHLDLVLRVTENSWRLPTGAEIGDGLCDAGFRDVTVREPVPGAGFVVATGSLDSTGRSE